MSSPAVPPRGGGGLKPMRTAHNDQASFMRSIPLPLHFGISVASGLDVLITVGGELDLASVPAFETAVRGIDFESTRHVALDLQPLDFIDAAGLHAVLALYEACCARSVALTIMPGPWQVHRVFELTATDRQLPFRSR